MNIIERIKEIQANGEGIQAARENGRKVGRPVASIPKETVVIIRSGRAFSGSSQWGYRALVSTDGNVSVWDDIAGHYTTSHSLTGRQKAYCRAIAKKQ